MGGEGWGEGGGEGSWEGRGEGNLGHMKTYKAPEAYSPQTGKEACVTPPPMFSWKRQVFLEEDHKSP